MIVSREALTVAGTLLVVASLGLLLRRGTPRVGEAEPPPGAVGRLVLAAAALASHLPGLERHSDASTLPARLALAPAAWPARWIAAGLRAQSHSAASGRGGMPSPALGRLVAGARLLTGVLAAPPLVAVCVAWFGAPASALAGSVALATATRLPDVVLAAAARRAVRSARHDTAATVDVLAATAAAGLSLPEAMVLTAGHAPPALAAVLRAAAVRRAMGGEPGAALAAEARRYGLPMLGEVAQALEWQRLLGTPLGAELSRIAGRMRAEHRAAALRRAARRGPLATLAVALVIAPTCLAAVVACLVGGLLQGGTLPLR